MSGALLPMPHQEGMTVPVQPIVFFDGVCGLCNMFVDLLLAIDTEGVLLFAPLQGETARRALGPLAHDVNAWSIILLDPKGQWAHSDAALRIFGHVGWPWSLLTLLAIVPRDLRDRVYEYVAVHRYAWFGKKGTCRLPTAEERARFLP